MSKFVVMATWDDVPHLSKQDKDDLWNSIPPFQRDARSKGIPQLGAGAIYPVVESEIVIDPFRIPKSWPRSYGLDVGWNRTAAVWQAWDQDNDIVYLYDEHYRSGCEPPVHAAAIKARGSWMYGVVDPAARTRSQVDGSRLIELYGGLDLNLDMADNAVESGIMTVWDRLSSGRLKVFTSLTNWRVEFRMYRRDEKGKIVKTNDHLMDATRYLIQSGLRIAGTEPLPEDRFDDHHAASTRSSVTGY